MECVVFIFNAHQTQVELGRKWSSSRAFFNCHSIEKTSVDTAKNKLENEKSRAQINVNLTVSQFLAIFVNFQLQPAIDLRS